MIPKKAANVPIKRRPNPVSRELISKLPNKNLFADIEDYYSMVAETHACQLKSKVLRYRFDQVQQRLIIVFEDGRKCYVEV